MAIYTYTAKSGPDATIENTIEAESEQDAISKLTQLGLFPLAVELEDFAPKKQGFFSTKRIHTRDLVQFTRQFATLSTLE